MEILLIFIIVMGHMFRVPMTTGEGPWSVSLSAFTQAAVAVCSSDQTIE